MTLPSFTPLVSLLLIPLLIAPPGWSQTAPSSAPQNNLQLRLVDSDGSQIAVSSHSTKGFYVQVTDGNGAPVAEAAVALRLPDSGATGLFADGSHSAVAYTDASGRAHLDGIQWNATAGALAVRVTATKGDEHAGILVEQALVAGVVSSPRPNLPAPRLEAAVAPANPAPAQAAADDSAPLNTIGGSLESVRPAIRAAAPGAAAAPFLRSAEPSVSISNDGTGPAYHGTQSGSKRKWLILGLVVAAGAGAAFAASTMGKGSTAASSSSISIGAPTVSVGHP